MFVMHNSLLNFHNVFFETPYRNMKLLFGVIYNGSTIVSTCSCKDFQTLVVLIFKEFPICFPNSNTILDFQG
jgi:hypothetical protein